MHYLEGPELFRYNDEDVKVVNGRTMPFGLMCDQYAESKGYLSFRVAHSPRMIRPIGSAQTISISAR